ncbi:MAG: hypothetical protein ACP5PW_00970 [Candidatus Dormibacteria bacterium]
MALGEPLVAFGAPLADDARRGDDTSLNRCGNRSEVTDIFRRHTSAGVEGKVSFVKLEPAGPTDQLTVTRPAGGRRARTETRSHVYRVGGEGITVIETNLDWHSAVAALG